MASCTAGTLSEDAKAAIALGSERQERHPRPVRDLHSRSAAPADARPEYRPANRAEPQGNHDRGKLIFFSDGARCRNCHESDDKSKSVGPTLLDIAKKYPKPSDMLEHVLKPSLKIDEPFAAYIVLTDDGRAINGLLVEKTDQEVVLKTAEKQIVRIKTADIDRCKKSDKSLMPDRILSDLTPQEAADLFEYIRSQAGGK